MPKAAPKTKTKEVVISTKSLTAQQKEELLTTLEQRFSENTERHKGMTWAAVEKRLTSRPKKLWSLFYMEHTGGEPDVVGKEKSGALVFMDCSAESPARRSVCYDEQARKERKKFPPKQSAEGIAKKMGVELLSEDDYRLLQSHGEFDLKTSSWISTPKTIRKHGGALFGDRRYDHVFIYHNGADSYYGARGFRAKLLV